MIRRILSIAMIVLLPTVLTACPDSGDSELEDGLEESVEAVEEGVEEVEEGVEEVEEEVDDGV